MAERLAYLEAVIGADITQFRRGMAEVRNESGLLSERSKGLSAVGRTMTYTLTAPLLAIGTLAASAAGEFDENMRNVNAIARMSESQLHSLSQETLEWGKNTRSGAIEASDALYTVYSAGVTNAEQAMRIMQVSTLTAEAGLADLTVTTEALTATLLAYSNKTEAFTWRASNAITAMVALGVGEMETFAHSMSKPLTTAARLGVQVEELFATMAFLTQRGESPAKASTQTFRLLAGLIKPAKGMKAALSKLGVSGAKELIAQYGSLQAAILAVVDTTDGSLESINKLWANVLGARGVTTLTSDVDAWNEALEEFDRLLPEATMLAHAEQMKSFKSQVDKLKKSFEAVSIVIGDQVIPVVTSLMAKMTTFFIKITDANPKLIKMGVAFAGIVAAVGPLLWILPSILNPMTLIIAGLGLLSAAFLTDFNSIRTTIKTKVETITGDLDPLFADLTNLWNILFPSTEETDKDKSILDMLNISRPTSDQMKEVFTPETPVSLWSLFEASIAKDEGFSWHWFMDAAAKAGWTGGAIPAGQTLVIEYDGVEIDIAGGVGGFDELYMHLTETEGYAQPDVAPLTFGERFKKAIDFVLTSIKQHFVDIFNNIKTYLQTEAGDDISEWWTSLKDSISATWEDHKPRLKARFDLFKFQLRKFFIGIPSDNPKYAESSTLSKWWTSLKDSISATWEDHKPRLKARFDLFKFQLRKFFIGIPSDNPKYAESSTLSKWWTSLKDSISATWEDHKPRLKARFDLFKFQLRKFFIGIPSDNPKYAESSTLSKWWTSLKDSISATWEDHKPRLKARFDLFKFQLRKFFIGIPSDNPKYAESSTLSKWWTSLKDSISATWEDHKPRLKASIRKIGEDISGFFSGGFGGTDVGGIYIPEDTRSPFQKAFDSMTTGIDTWYAENSPTILAKITTIASGIKGILKNETNIASIAEGVSLLLAGGFAPFSTLNAWFAEEFPTIHADLTLIAKGIGDWFKDDGADVVAYGIGYFVGSIGVKISQGLIKLKDFFFGGNLIAFLGEVQQGAETFGSGFNQALTDSGVEDFTFADKILTGIVGALVTYSIGATVFAPFGAKIIGAITSSIGFAALGKAVGLTSMSLKVVKMVGSGIFSLSASVYATLLAPAASKILSGVTSAIGAATSLPVTSAGISIGMKISGLVNAAFAGVSAVAGTFSTVASFVMAGIVQDIKTGSLSLAGTRTAIALLVDGAFVGVKAVGSRFKNAGLWARQGISTAILSGQINLMGIKDKISTAISAALGTGLAKGLISGASGALAAGAVVATALAPVAFAIGAIALVVGAVKFASDEDFRHSVHKAILKVLSGRDFLVPMSVSPDIKTKVEFEEAGYDPEAFDSFSMARWLLPMMQANQGVMDWIADVNITSVRATWEPGATVNIPEAPAEVKEIVTTSWNEAFGDTNPWAILDEWHADLDTFKGHAVAIADLLGFDPNSLDEEAITAIVSMTNMADAQANLVSTALEADITGEEFVTTYLTPINTAWVGMYGEEGTMTAAYSTFVTGLVEDTTTLSTTMDTLNTDASEDILAFKDSAVSDFGKAETAVNEVKTEVDALSASLNDLDGLEVSFTVSVTKIETEPEGSHATGLGYVPHDNYRANLHKGEMVLPRYDAETYRRGQGEGVTNIYNRIEVHAESADDILRELDRRGIYVE